MAPKRKSVKGGVEPKNKKVKTAIHQKEPNTLLSLEELTNLSKEIDESLKFNNLVPLLEQFKLIKTKLIESIDPDVESTARKLSLLLYRNFNKINDEIISNGNGVKSSASEDKKMIIKWLLEKYTTFKDIIYGFIEDKLAGSTSLQLDLLDIILNFIRLESQRKSSTSQVVFFPTQSYKSLTESILNSKNGEILFDGTTDNFIVLEFLDKFQKYWDLQFYFFNNLSEVLNEWKQEKSEKDLQLIFANFLTVLRKGLLFNEKTLEEEPLWIAPNKEGKLPSSLYKHTLFKS